MTNEEKLINQLTEIVNKELLNQNINKEEYEEYFKDLINEGSKKIKSNEITEENIESEAYDLLKTQILLAVFDIKEEEKIIAVNELDEIYFEFEKYYANKEKVTAKEVMSRINKRLNITSSESVLERQINEIINKHTTSNKISKNKIKETIIKLVEEEKISQSEIETEAIKIINAETIKIVSGNNNDFKKLDETIQEIILTRISNYFKKSAATVEEINVKLEELINKELKELAELLNRLYKITGQKAIKDSFKAKLSYLEKAPVRIKKTMEKAILEQKVTDKNFNRSLNSLIEKYQIKISKINKLCRPQSKRLLRQDDYEEIKFKLINMLDNDSKLNVDEEFKKLSNEYEVKNKKYNEQIAEINQFTAKFKEALLSEISKDLIKEYNALLNEEIALRDEDKKDYKIFLNIEKILDNPQLISELNDIELPDIKAEIENKDYLSKSERTNLINKYKKIHLKIDILKDYLSESNEFNDFLEYYNDLINYKDLEDNKPNRIKDHNTNYIKTELAKHKEFFDNINGKSLDANQRRAVVIDEDNTQIIAGAGTGKTLTLEAKIKYLIEKKGVDPNKILCLSYSRASVKELKERLSNTLKNKKISVKTFHSLGTSIMESYGQSTTVEEELLENKIHEYLTEDIFNDSEKIQKLVEYFSYYRSDYETFTETMKTKLSKDDTDEFTYNSGETYIANYLYLHDIDYIREKEYSINGEIPLKDYKAGFYLPEYDIYIEHFLTDENLNHIKLDAVNAETYIDNIKTIRNLHKEHNTQLIETFEEYENTTFEKQFEKHLTDADVDISKTNYENVYTLMIKDEEFDDFDRFKTLIKTFINLFDGNRNEISILDEFINDNLENNPEYLRDEEDFLLNTIKEIYVKYINYKKDNKLIDFNDMINKAIDLIEERGYNKKYDYILIDEFQDTSKVRYMLIKALQKDSSSKIIIVGDDWQSIYHFTGCDLSLFVDFKDNESAEVVKIVNTHRNSQRLINISSEFIQKNPYQESKRLISDPNVKQLKKPINLCYYGNKTEEVLNLEAAIKEIVENSDKPLPEILILGRNKRTIYGLLDNCLFENAGYRDNHVNIIYKKNPSLNIRYMTVHSAKGLEADAVIMIGLTDHVAGFPNKIREDSILSYVNKKTESYPHSEERRLFYVGLTRTRTYCYLLVPNDKPSIFIRELEMNFGEIRKEFTFPAEYREKVRKSIREGIEYVETGLTCPKCGIGHVRVSINHEKFNKWGLKKKNIFCSFKGCNWNTPYSPELKDIKDLELMDYCPDPNCDGLLIKKQNSKTKKYFMGCSNFTTKNCGETINNMKKFERNRGFANKKKKRKIKRLE